MVNPMQMFLNPKGMIKSAVNNSIQNNPHLKEAIDYINANGGDPKEAFYKLAEEKGVDPQEFLNSLNLWS